MMRAYPDPFHAYPWPHVATVGDQEGKTEVAQPTDEEEQLNKRAVKTIPEMLRKAMTVAHPKSTEDLIWTRSTGYRGKKSNSTANLKKWYLHEPRW